MLLLKQYERSSLYLPATLATIQMNRKDYLASIWHFYFCSFVVLAQRFARTDKAFTILGYVNRIEQVRSVGTHIVRTGTHKGIPMDSLLASVLDTAKPFIRKA